ncbi:MAG: NADPH:quinone oxidoreductase family protein [Chloroflexi bacterium]|nr:NADPH:quinone oxidoreductase family protein [Chloroflexota bacterium]
MRALQVTELSGPDAVRVVDVPEPADDERILLRVHAVGLSFPDVLRSKGLYQQRAEPPYTLGGEVAGLVVSAPAGTGFRPGDRLAATCAAGAAEYAVVEPRDAIRLPTSMSFAAGAALPLNYPTAILGLELRGRMRAGETLLVHGAAGGTGTAAIQVARAAGCRVFGVVSSEAKERAALEAGAEVALRSDAAWKDAALELTAGQGVDLVWDPVGGDRVLDTMRALAPGGRWVVVGFTGGPVPSVALNRVLLRNIDVVGSYIGGYLAQERDGRQRLNSRLAELLAGGHIHPLVGAHYALDDGAEALRAIDGRQAIGKVVLQVA